MIDSPLSASEALRAARGILAFQRRVVGPTRYLSGAESGSALVAEAAEAEAPAVVALPEPVRASVESLPEPASAQPLVAASVEPDPEPVPTVEPESAAPEPVQPERVQPASITPEVAPSESAAPEPTFSEPPVSEPTTPEPVVSRPEIPEPTAPEPVAAEPSVFEPEVTEPEAPAPPPADPSPEPLPDASVPDLFGSLPDPSQDPGLSPYERIEALIPEGSPLHGMTSLDEIFDYLAHNVLIPIDEGRINPVLGTGNPNADLMVIGEAPGADEDRLGEPFVGRSGQLLDKILEAILFKREDVYISNILKSRPPGNRDPLPEEVAAHIPILYKQIALVKPKMLLAVGKSAGNGLLGKNASLASLRGKFQDFYGLPMIVTYHPAALLRNPQWKRPVWEDVKLLRTRYDQIVDASK